MRTIFILTITIFLISTVFCQDSHKKVVYVDQSTQVSEDDQEGTQDAPYSSLDDAFDELDDDGGEIIFQGGTYVVDKKITFETDKRHAIVINFMVPEGFTFEFKDQGQINCLNYPQNILEVPVKNVNLTIQNTTIFGKSKVPVFIGNCNFTLQNVSVKGLTSPLFYVGIEGNILLDTVTIDDINIPEEQNMIDHVPQNRIEGDYLIIDSVMIKNMAPTSSGHIGTGIRSWLQWKHIEVTNSVLEGIGFNIAGEQIGGNLKTNITIFNVRMQNAMTFVSIASYGTLLIQDSSFENATYRAILFSLTDENLSPNQITIHNCRFIGNTAPIEGGAIAFQGTSITNYQFNLNVLVQKSTFHNNKAALSGGAIAFLSLIQGNATIADSDFQANVAESGGGCVHVAGASSAMQMVMKNTRCASNSAFQGGVFNIELTEDLPLTLADNNWEDNTATGGGSIGYLCDSTVTLTESGVNYTTGPGSWELEGQSSIVRVDGDGDGNGEGDSAADGASDGSKL